MMYYVLGSETIRSNKCVKSMCECVSFACNAGSFCVPGMKMRKFAYCKVVLATSLVWVMLDMFILLYFSECNKCDDKKERGLPGRDGVCIYIYISISICNMYFYVIKPAALWGSIQNL